MAGCEIYPLSQNGPGRARGPGASTRPWGMLRGPRACSVVSAQGAQGRPCLASGCIS